jgi:SH3 domain protein
MKKFRHLFALFCLSISSFSFSQESSYTDGYISDDLFIYMHAGPGTNYRILGTVIAGTQVQVTGESSNDYSEVIDEKGRKTWVETKYVNDKPGIRFAVAELNSQLTNASSTESTLNTELERTKLVLGEVQEKNNQLTNQLTQLNNELSSTKLQLKSQDVDIQKEWFFNGAIVLAIGLILGLLIPLVSSRKRKADTWR